LTILSDLTYLIIEELAQCLRNAWPADWLYGLLMTGQGTPGQPDS